MPRSTGSRPLRPLPPPPDVRGDRPAGPRRRLQRPRARRSGAGRDCRDGARGPDRDADGPPAKYINSPGVPDLHEGRARSSACTRRGTRSAEGEAPPRRGQLRRRVAARARDQQRRRAARHRVHARAGQAAQALRARRRRSSSTATRRARRRSGRRATPFRRGADLSGASPSLPRGSTPTTLAQEGQDEAVATS